MSSSWELSRRPVAAAELADAGRRVVVLDQESEANLGGRAHWSFGGLFRWTVPSSGGWGSATRSPWQDWQGSARLRPAGGPLAAPVGRGFALDFAAGEKRSWLHQQGVRFFPVVGWPSAATAAPAGTATCAAPTSRGAPAPGCSSRSCAGSCQAQAAGRLSLLFRHRVDALVVSAGR